MNQANLNFDDVSGELSTLPPLLDDTSIEVHLDRLAQYGFTWIDQLYPGEFVQSLREEFVAQQALFRQAEIQQGRMTEIRSDHILWINAQFALAHRHCMNLLQLAEVFNRAFYLGLHEVEAHFAHYHAGEFYKLHRDNPQGKNGRVISTVYYLHEHWQADHGGELRLQDKHGEWHVIEPQPNRLAIFQSDLLHEVLMNHHHRLSITAWLRQRNEVV